MVANRQDAWTPDDDLLLAEVTLRYIREGGTQLRAFEEVAEKLGRTPAACGFRWNSTVRKNYEEAIAIAKEQRQKNKQKKTMKGKEKLDLPLQKSTEQQMGNINFEQVIEFLKEHKQRFDELRMKKEQLEEELRKKSREVDELKAENERLLNEHNNVKSVNEDYRTLLQIMERARKLALFEGEEDKPIFKMDGNGNLERINK